MSKVRLTSGELELVKRIEAVDLFVVRRGVDEAVFQAGLLVLGGCYAQVIALDDREIGDWLLANASRYSKPGQQRRVLFVGFLLSEIQLRALATGSKEAGWMPVGALCGDDHLNWIAAFAKAGIPLPDDAILPERGLDLRKWVARFAATIKANHFVGALFKMVQCGDASKVRYIAQLASRNVYGEDWALGRAIASLAYRRFEDAEDMANARALLIADTLIEFRKGHLFGEAPSEAIQFSAEGWNDVKVIGRQLDTYEANSALIHLPAVLDLKRLKRPQLETLLIQHGYKVTMTAERWQLILAHRLRGREASVAAALDERGLLKGNWKGLWLERPKGDRSRFQSAVASCVSQAIAH